MAKNDLWSRIYDEISDALDLLDNTTALEGSEDSLGQAELALARAREAMIADGAPRLIAEAPAMLAALRKISQGADCFTFNSDADAFRFVDMVAEAVAPILARIDGAAPAPTAPALAPSGGIEGLPEGYAMERDQDGDPILIPPANVTIFSEPGEGWLVTADYMQGRDWNSESDVIAACCDYLRSIGREG